MMLDPTNMDPLTKEWLEIRAEIMEERRPAAERSAWATTGCFG
jgi:hypothetical protein